MRWANRLSWGEDGTVRPGRERAELADGTLILDWPNAVGDVAIRFCPIPPAGVTARDVPDLRKPHPRGSAAWHQAGVYDPRIGSGIAEVYDVYLAYQIVEEARDWAGRGLPARAIAAAGFIARPPADDAPQTALYVRPTQLGQLCLSLGPEGTSVHFERRRTRARVLVARFHRSRQDDSGTAWAVRWPDGWGEPDHLIALVLYAQDWAERCGVTGRADCISKRERGSALSA